ncbi:ShlB/FhaC/HecB family hemolysin secretion/activation protein [Kalamiella sp. sgz302252]|uniref:ShlB/FhaC/HecB family hemolysin secretion/activation protein n=1 Tax=Pantoea sp. sgz302252 TaxID=3341827 RepID=UPI0036D237B6
MNQYTVGPGKACLLLLLGQICTPLYAVASPTPISQAAEIDAREQMRQQERARAMERQNQPESEARLARPAIALPDYPAAERPCFPIKGIALTGDDGRFQWALKAAEDARGRCLGAQGIMLALNKVQNAILQKGYITTRIMAQEQDLSQGMLTLTLQPGRIDRILFTQPVSKRARLWNVMPASPGAILNLRDIEQALENFRRVPGVEADISIEPGLQEATSDLKIAWRESRPVHLNIGLDDSGAKSTGKYQGSLTLAVNAPFAQNDLFYVSLGRDMFEHGPYASRSRTVNYNIPYGYWLFSANYNDYSYQQNITSANDTLTYSGQSENTQLALSRLLFRNQAHKTTFNLRLWRRHATNAVNGIDIAQQQRRTAGWELGLSQRSYFGNATTDASLNWRKGTGLFNAQPAPEEKSNDGSARTSMFTSDISLNLPIATTSWRYHTSLRGQWSRHALTPQDRLAIGGRYTVRGFDGEQMLSGEKGAVWRNELAWNLRPTAHELYWGVDYGRVGGQGARYLAGKALAGSALGVRGALWQRLSYDLFVSVPLAKPAGLHTSGVTGGFSFNLQL